MLYIVLIANQTIDIKIKDNLRGVPCKLDTEKNYDHVNYNCIIAVMEKMGFRLKLVEWIRWYIYIAHCAISRMILPAFLSKF